MATLTVQTLTRAGLRNDAGAGTACAAGGDVFSNDGRTFIELDNGHTSAQTVNVQAWIEGAWVTVRSVAVTNGQGRIIGPFPMDWNNASGQLNLTYSGVTALTIAAYTLPAS
jgi:hypothetical protein